MYLSYALDFTIFVFAQRTPKERAKAKAKGRAKTREKGKGEGKAREALFPVQAVDEGGGLAACHRWCPRRSTPPPPPPHLPPLSPS